MKADPFRQQRLLELQALDTRLGQLEHQIRTLPEHAALADLQARAEDADAEVVRLRTAHDDVQRELAKADADVTLVRDRATRDQQRLEAGSGSPKDLQGLQHELTSLARRQATLEDVEIEVMERAEELAAAVERAERTAADLAQEATTVTGERDANVSRLNAEHLDVAAGRAAVVAEVGEELLALYDRVRAHSGTGAAALVARRCTGCRLELTASDVSKFRSAASDEVLRCEECRRILIRTPESGL